MASRSAAKLAFVYLSAAFALGIVFTLVWQHVIAERETLIPAESNTHSIDPVAKDIHEMAEEARERRRQALAKNPPASPQPE